jgi:hypothetical protein
MKTVRDVYVEAGKLRGLTEKEMEIVFSRAAMRAPLNLEQEVPEADAPMMVKMLAEMIGKLPRSFVKAAAKEVERQVRHNN